MRYRARFVIPIRRRRERDLPNRSGPGALLRSKFPHAGVVSKVYFLVHTDGVTLSHPVTTNRHFDCNLAHMKKPVEMIGHQAITQ